MAAIFRLSLRGLFLGLFVQVVSSFLVTKNVGGVAKSFTRGLEARQPVSLWSSSPQEVKDLTPSSDGIRTDKNDLDLLVDCIGFNTSAATTLLTQINEMRGESPERLEDYLNNLLSAGPDAPLPWWSRSKRMARFSKRARMFSLRRTLDLTTPPPSESEDDQPMLAALQRRRRALVALVRTLSSETSQDNKIPAIVAIERKAIKASKDTSDLRSRLPEGLETPDYDLVSKRDASQKSIEIRRYKPFSVCAVSMNSPRPDDKSRTDAKVQMPEMSGASSFGALAGYLFGKNDKSTAMKMTTPVLTSPTSSNSEDKQMAFVLPSEYWDSSSLEAAPQPLLGSGVTLQQKESEERAVLMFGGYASKKEVVKRKEQLMAALAKDQEWAAIEEEATVAQYNDPFTVPWKRLNEVSVKVAKK